MSGAALRFDGVACVRGGRLIFEALDLAVEPGGAALITGPNGAGKSSLLRLAAGLLTPAAGRILREGRTAIADENTALDRPLALGHALLFWARIDGRGPDAVRQGLEDMGIAHLENVPVRMLSTGQRKRATIARVIASGAPIWLLDEPANGLDTDSIARLETVIAAHRATGGIVLVASHQALDLPDAGSIRLEGA